MKVIILSLASLFLVSCASHQYDGIRGQNGEKSRVVGKTLVSQVQKYQFVPDTVGVIVEARELINSEAKRRKIEIENVNVTTERNPLLGVTSGIATADIISR